MHPCRTGEVLPAMTRTNQATCTASAARRAGGCVLVATLALLPAGHASADEGGASFWLPGQFASFAALPGDPGWSFGGVYYHGDASSNASRDFQIGGNLAAGIDVHSDLAFVSPTYTFKTPVLGAQAALMLTGVFGRMDVSARAILTGPGGSQVSVRRDDATTGAGDLYPMGTLKWQHGDSSYLAYLTADAPVGGYELGRLANLGLNHWAIDGGGGYTYLDTTSGHEASVTAGITYNFQNNATQYRNGVDSHIDWALSQFLSEKVHIGVAGYVYYQLSGDSGSGDKVGAFESRVFSAGPEAGYFFPFGASKGYVQLKSYFEWGGTNRPEGWNGWLSVYLPLGGG